MPSVSNKTQNVTEVTQYLEWLECVRGRSAGTVASYRQVLRAWTDWLGSRSLAAADYRDVELFSLRQRSGRASSGVGSAATRAKDIDVLSAFYRFRAQAISKGCANPAVLAGRPKVQNRTPRALDDDVWEVLWESASDMERVWLGLGFFCGLRRHELCALTGRHFNLDSGQIVGFPRKGGADDVFAYRKAVQVFTRFLPQFHASQWQHVLEDRVRVVSVDELVVDWQAGPVTDSARARYGDVLVEPNVVTRRLKSLCVRAGLDSDAVTPHALRHSFVSNMLRGGVPVHIVSQLAAHSDIRITQTYMRGSGAMLDEWLNRDK